MFVTHLVHTAKNSTECPNRANSECKQPNKKKKENSFSARFTAQGCPRTVEYQYRILPIFQSSQLRRSICIVNTMLTIFIIWYVLSLFMKKFRKRRIYIYFNASFLFVNKREALAGNVVDANKQSFQEDTKICLHMLQYSQWYVKHFPIKEDISALALAVFSTSTLQFI